LPVNGVATQRCMSARIGATITLSTATTRRVSFVFISFLLGY